MTEHEATVRRLARALSEISHTLESTDARHRRVERALDLARDIVPASQCAVLEINGDAPTLYVSPDEPTPTRDALATKMTALYRLVAGGDEIGRTSETRPSLALPVMGLDEIIGVIRVETTHESYDARHLRLLSVIAAQIGAYLAMVRLREREAARIREIEAAHDFQRLLAGVVSHDLRNPLSVIMTVASTMLETVDDPTQIAALRRALRNAEHATHLIADLVDVTESRVSGVIRVAPVAEDFAETVERTVDDLRVAHGRRTIELSLDCERPLRGRFDPVRLAQIVTNLVNNATIHGEASLPIHVRVSDQGANVIISVRNWGPAIPAALMSTIFDPFKQGAPAAHKPTRGLGLGLYIVDRLAKGHGGSVTVSSDVEIGTVFRVMLPRYAAPPIVEAMTPHTGHPLVMIVDDDADVRMGLSAILEKRGYEVATAEHGLEALRMLRGGLRPKLVFLDYSMPVMNGEEFCEQCAQDPALAAIPIVVVSADTASAVKLARNRSLGVLTKPVAIDKLVAAIDSIK